MSRSQHDMPAFMNLVSLLEAVLKFDVDAGLTAPLTTIWSKRG